MNYLTVKTLLRNLLKNKFLTSVQIGGLIIGFGIVMFLFVKIYYEHSYDRFWKDHDSVYRLGLDLKYQDGRSVKSARNFHGSTELLEAEVPGVAAHCNMARDMITVYFQEKKIQDVDWFWSDTTFFSVFDRKILHRESSQLFGDRHGIVISQSFARKLFGNENPINKEISLNEGWKFLIKGVFEDIPVNSHLKVDVLGSYESLTYFMRNYDPGKQVLNENPDFVYEKPSPYTSRRWTSSMQTRPFCYLRLKPNCSIEDVKAAVQPSLRKVGMPASLQNSSINFIFQPVAYIHLQSNLDNEIRAQGSAMQVNFLVVIGLVVLIVCFVNYLNLSTISTIEDRKSYSIRLLNGSRKRNILGMLLARNTLLYFLALLCAIPLAVFIIRSKLPESTIPSALFWLMPVLAILGAIIASVVPYLSIFNTPVFISLKGQSQGLNQNWTSRKALVVMQFAISIILVITTIGIYKQMNFAMKEKLGFSGAQSVFCFTPMTMTNHPDIPVMLHTFRDEVMALSGVSSFSASSSVPGREVRRWRDNIMPANSAEPYPASIGEISIDDKFLSTYNMSLIAGENLEERSNWISDEVLINRSAAELMGFQNPADAIGNTFSFGQNSFKVKGVIENYHHVSLHQQIKPAIYFQNLQWELSVGYYSFMVAGADIAGVMKQVEKIWKKLYPRDEFVYRFSNKEFEAQYSADVNFNQILGYSALLALVVSCLGLLSLAMFSTKQRIKEIGVRKVNGANVSEVMALLNKDFIKWVVIAFIIAAPISWYAMQKWLENFAYKTELSWWVFALAGVMALGIALLTVSWQSWKAATRNPVESLRYE